MITSKNTVLRIIAGKTDEPVFAEISSDRAISAATWSISDRDGSEITSGNCEINSHGASLFCAF